MDQTRTRTYILAGALLLAVLLYFYFRVPSSATTGTVAADQKFEPLDVQEPDLRLDLIERLHTLKYEGAHRNIFSAIPPPPPEVVRKNQDIHNFVGPRRPPPPPPVQFSAQFFGTATMPASGAKLAFFQQGDDVVVVQEGEELFGRFRLTHIGADSVTVEEISSGRTTLVPMQPPVDQGSSNPTEANAQ
ncbi:MAG TPA: hypothetical protein VMJ93_01290 [Verrucomicrobiae bacterium]|nr:hypothetical protein [Verrucomicrobiae bacterium]